MREPGRRHELAEYIERIAQRIARLERDDEVVDVGTVPVGISLGWPSFPGSRMVVTGERKRHFLDSHPEMSQLYPEIVLTLLEPDDVFRNLTDERIAVVVRRIEEKRHIRAAVLVTDDPRLGHSLMSAWKFREADYRRLLRRNERVWERG